MGTISTARYRYSKAPVSDCWSEILILVTTNGSYWIKQMHADFTVQQLLVNHSLFNGVGGSRTVLIGSFLVRIVSSSNSGFG